MAKKGIKKFEDLAKLGKADLHIHSNYSDGKPGIMDILEYVQNHTDLDVIAITDHDTIESALMAREIAEEKKYRFQVIIGEEVTSVEGHILGLFLTERIPADLPAHEVLKRIKKQGAISIASHPFEHSRMNNPDRIMMDGVGAATLIKEAKNIDAVETVNATPTLGEENIRADFLNKTILGLAETGSSDAHIKEAIGRGYTLFEGKTAEDLKEAILNHQTQAMHAKWTLMAIIKYLFFFMPRAIRIGLHTLTHGRRPKRPDLFR